MINNILTLNILIFFVFLSEVQATQNPVRVATASSFIPALKEIVKNFDGPVEIISGSSGKLYAQINHGAPFDLFFSADAKRPEKLAQQKKFSGRPIKTYAYGQLVYWAPGKSLMDEANLKLKNNRAIALANPRLAPFGRAAQQVLQKKFKNLEGINLVYGENAAQVFHFVKSNNAGAGFVSLSHIIQSAQTDHWRALPPELYDPIEQKVILLSRKTKAKELFDFVFSSKAEQIIEKYGFKAALR